MPTTDLPTLDPPAGRMIPELCWVLPAWYTYGEKSHFLTEHDALEEVRADRGDRWSSETVPQPMMCDRPDCVLKRKLAESAVQAHQEQLRAEQAVLVRDWYEEEDAYRAERLRVASVGVEQVKQVLDLQTAEAERRVRELALLDDQATRQEEALRLAQDQCDAQETAQEARTAVELARRLVDQAGADIGKADTKAGVVLTVELALIGATGAGTLGAQGVLRWVAIGALLIGVLAAASAVLPRMPRLASTGERLALNFGAIRLLDGAELAEQLRDIDELQATSQEAVNLARIAHRKYQRIRWSMQTGFTGLMLAIAAAIAGSW